jgi:regulator of RNase E activity RraB
VLPYTDDAVDCVACAEAYHQEVWDASLAWNLGEAFEGKWDPCGTMYAPTSEDKFFDEEEESEDDEQ